MTLQVPRASASSVAARVLSELPVADLTIEDPPIDDVIARVFETGAGHAAPAATRPDG